MEGFGAGNPAPWRAGANENTVLHYLIPQQLKAIWCLQETMDYFLLINQDNSGEVILSKDNKSWGNFWYDPKQDEMREKIKLRDGPPTEMLTYDFRDVSQNSAELVLSWEKKQFPVKIEFAVDDIVMANAAEELKGPVGFTWQGYASAANYSLQNKMDLEQGLKWADIAMQQNNSFATLSLKAGFLNKWARHPKEKK